jgi:AcrR family transcriptional regulator
VTAKLKRRQRVKRERMTVDARREQLLGLAIRAFSEQPYDEVSTEAIAAEAGVSHGLLFHYFPTKRALYVAALRVAAEQLLRATFTVQEGTPVERLDAGLHAYFAFIEEHAQAYATLLRGGVGFDPVVSELVDGTRYKIIEIIVGDLGALVPGKVPKRTLRAALRGWIGLVEALAIDWIAHRDLPRTERVTIAVHGFMAVLAHGSTTRTRR